MKVEKNKYNSQYKRQSFLCCCRLHRYAKIGKHKITRNIYDSIAEFFPKKIQSNIPNLITYSQIEAISDFVPCVFPEKPYIIIANFSHFNC